MLDIAAVCDVKQLVAIGADEVADVPIDILRIDLLGANPVWRVIGCVFLIEGRTIDSVGKPFEDQRPVEQMGNDVG